MFALPQFKDHPQTQKPPNRYLLTRPTTLKPQSVLKAVTVSLCGNYEDEAIELYMNCRWWSSSNVGYKDNNYFTRS
jgi:hypothetical protein